MAVYDLPMSQRRWGASRSRKALAVLPLSDRKTVGSLTDRQRQVLAAALIRL
jgi:predicted DNA binding protein